MLVAIRLEPDAYNDEQIQLAQKFAQQAAIALSNAMLFKEVTAFNHQLESAIQERTQALNDTYQKLEQLDRSKTDFLKMVARELQEPLGRMNGHAQYILAKAILLQDIPLRDAFDGFVDGLKRMDGIIERIQDVVLIDSDDFTIKQEPFHLSAILRNLRDAFAPVLRERHITINLARLDSLPALLGDERQIYKVFSHLVENSIRHTPNGGRITISATHRIHSTEKQSRSEVHITVSDTGVGIDPQVQKQIFEKFYRTRPFGAASKNEADSHAGLGLAIARGIIQAHGGRIWVESRGHDEVKLPGSHFHIILPTVQGISGKSLTTLPTGATL
jgi:signal transduction histidine kinase